MLIKYGDGCGTASFFDGSGIIIRPNSITRRYYVVVGPKGVVKPGKNRIVVRVLATDKSGFGGIFRNMFIYQKR
ncbi:MAG: hypothetical protein E7054_06640 [Lentisphaerae bacterium]|nr:hypothetical protein [Lentisphaerota bacterium]